jgi:hypothetical protein
MIGHTSIVPGFRCSQPAGAYLSMYSCVLIMDCVMCAVQVLPIASCERGWEPLAAAACTQSHEQKHVQPSQRRWACVNAGQCPWQCLQAVLVQQGEGTPGWVLSTAGYTFQACSGTDRQVVA